MARSIIVRVTGLPNDRQTDVGKFIWDFIESSLTEDEKTRGLLKPTSIKVVPSCSDPDHSTALVEFKPELPIFLESLSKNRFNDFQEETEFGDINFDCHFDGLTQLYPTKPDQKIDADIVAVTGLGGHAYGSWRGRGNLGRMWLRDFLCFDLPTCRTMTYGYNSKLDALGHEVLLDFARGLKQSLRSARRDENRPIIFVGHSFGGLVIAKCLLEEAFPERLPLFKATHAILFFGTPHLGLDVETLAHLIHSNHPRQQLLCSIAPHAKELIEQLRNFKEIIKHFKITSFYETLETPQVTKDITGQLARDGPMALAVDSRSALLQLPSHMENPISVPMNHSEMVKYDSRSDRTYQSVSLELQRYTNEVQSPVPAELANLVENNEMGTRGAFEVQFQLLTRPAYFYGEEEELSAVINSICSEKPARIAILGTEGVGKTTLAVAAMHEQKVVDKYPRRYWVALDASISEGLVLIELENALQIPLECRTGALGQALFNMLCREAALLCFDSFETPWENDQEKAEGILQKVSGIATLAIIVILRGILRPGGDQIDWSRPLIPSLSVFQYKDAMILFEKRSCSKLGQYSEKLISAVNHLPLAMTLLASLVRDGPDTTESLWMEWVNVKTAMIETGGSDCLSSLDVSIKLPVFSKVMEANSSYSKILALLSFLPYGSSTSPDMVDRLKHNLPSDLKLQNSSKFLW